MKTQSILLALSGIVIGCAAGATMTKTSAHSDEGKWQCLKVSLLPDIDRAESLAEAKGYASTLNEIAAAAPVGSVLQVSPDNNGYNFLCAKQ